MVRLLFESVWMLIAKSVRHLLATWSQFCIGLIFNKTVHLRTSISAALIILLFPQENKTHRSNLKWPCWPPSFPTWATDWLFCQIKGKTHIFLPGGSGQHTAYMGSCPLITAEEQYICSVCHSFMSYWLLKLSLQPQPRKKTGFKKVYMDFTCLCVVDSLKGLQITNPLYEI